MNHLADYQEQFFNSLLKQPSAQFLMQIETQNDDPTTVATTRFSVYQNNYIHGLVQALQDAYPVIVKLLGEVFFKGLAKEYVINNPPIKASMQTYGKTFPDYLASHEQCRELPYLAAVANIEYLYIQCFHGPDVEAINLNHLLAEDEDNLPNVEFEMHPNVFLIASDFPALDIWYANLDEKVTEIDLDSLSPSTLLMHRNAQLQVETIELNSMAYQFCELLSRRHSIAQAWDKLQNLSQHSLSDDDLNGMLSYFLGLGVFSGLSIKTGHNS